MFRNKSALSHDFAMVPRSDIPRSRFKMMKALKTTFDAGYLVPMFCEEVLPGDTMNVRMTAFARLSTPIFPTMDNLHFETFFFFVPNRLLWTNWVKFMGEQTNPGDSISYTIPQVVSPVGGWGALSIYDYFGLPVAGQVDPAQAIGVNVLPLRAYNQIWNEWFRDENLVTSVPKNVGDGPDASANYTLLLRGKRHDYFTSALPFLQKGTAVGLPLTGNAIVRTSATPLVTGVQTVPMRFTQLTGGAVTNNRAFGSSGTGDFGETTTVTVAGPSVYPNNLYADLASVTAATINQLRQAFQIQKLLERDARGGTRYAEIVRAHFGVVSPDARLQRPEYLGGGHQYISINPIAQTSATGLTGATTPQANLAAFGTMLAKGHGFTQSFTEHGYIIGLMNVRADLSYQQGTRRMWSRLTRYDFYFPAFAMLGEQAILNKEIYTRGDSNDNLVFGYQERWAEYRYNPSQITGLFRSTTTGTIDPWHYAQRFTALPTLNSTFIQEQTGAVLSRTLAVGASANGQQLIMDAMFEIIAARPMPMYSVPGLIDHF